MKSNESIERGTFMPMRARVVLAVSVTAMMGACAPVEPPGGSYYEERIEPFFSNRTALATSRTSAASRWATST
jgi:hypothetical protein